MSENDRMDDARFARDVLRRLPTVAVPAALETRILADFDGILAHRAERGRAGVWRRFGERLWPGVPVWQPASILALSLIIGLTAGTFVPAPATTSQVSEQVITALDVTSDVDEDRDG